MQVSIDKHFEKVLRDQVRSGLYQNASEAVRDAIRHAFCHDNSDDTPLLAEKLREAKDSPRSPYVPGEFSLRLKEKIAKRRKKAAWCFLSSRPKHSLQIGIATPIGIFTRRAWTNWRRLNSPPALIGPVEITLQLLARHPEIGQPRVAQFSDLTGYRGHNLAAPFGRFRIYYRLIKDKELHVERLLEGHQLAASDYRWYGHYQSSRPIYTSTVAGMFESLLNRFRIYYRIREECFARNVFSKDIDLRRVTEAACGKDFRGGEAGNNFWLTAQKEQLSNSRLTNGRK